MRAELDNVLQSLSNNDYSVYSLIDDILAHSNREDPRIKQLREGTERDAAVICTRLLVHNPASASVSAWALGVAQSTLLSKLEETADHPLSLRNQVRNNLSSGKGWTSPDGPEGVLNFGRAQLCSRHAVTIDMLPDNVFLEIFDIFLGDPTIQVMERTRKWQRLVHICQRWRRIIFASPRRLDLHLSCSYRTRVRKNLVFWPVTLPLIIDCPLFRPHPVPDSEDEDSVVAALEHHARVHRICIFVDSSVFRKVVRLMQKSFPALTRLDIESPYLFNVPLPVVPRRFLGGSAPRLQHLRLKCVSFPELPTLLLSARNLVTLKLEEISRTGYISPEAMVGSLAVLTRLTTLSIEFYNENSLPEQITTHPYPPMRAILPSLADFHYTGCSEYLEDVLAQIDAPRIDNLRIEYFEDEDHEIQARQFSQFIDRTENLKLDRFRRAEVIFYSESIYVQLDHPQGERRQAQVSLKFLHQSYLDMQVACVTPVLGELVAMFSNVDHLTAHGDYIESEVMDAAEWLPFFRLFPAAEALHLSGALAAHIASALEATARAAVTDVFPVLHLLWLDQDDNKDCNDPTWEPVPVGSIEKFLSLRQQCTGRPVTVVNTEDEFFEADERPL